MQVAGAERGPTGHGGAEQLSRAREVGCLLARALGHFERIA